LLSDMHCTQAALEARLVAVFVGVKLLAEADVDHVSAVLVDDAPYFYTLEQQGLGFTEHFFAFLPQLDVRSKLHGAVRDAGNGGRAKRKIKHVQVLRTRYYPRKKYLKVGAAKNVK